MWLLATNFFLLEFEAVDLRRFEAGLGFRTLESLLRFSDFFLFRFGLGPDFLDLGLLDLTSTFSTTKASLSSGGPESSLASM